jgi:hypothetical protein
MNSALQKYMEGNDHDVIQRGATVGPRAVSCPDQL